MDSTHVILDVNPDFESLDWEQDHLRGLGVHATRCLGPDTSAGCPLLEGRSCPKTAAADGALFQLDLECAHHRQILARYMDMFGPRLTVVVGPEEALTWAALIEGANVIVGPPAPADLARVARRSQASPSPGSEGSTAGSDPAS